MCSEQVCTSGATAERWKMTAGTERMWRRNTLVRLVENSAATRGLKHTADHFTNTFGAKAGVCTVFVYLYTWLPETRVLGERYGCVTLLGGCVTTTLLRGWMCDNDINVWMCDNNITGWSCV